MKNSYFNPSTPSSFSGLYSFLKTVKKEKDKINENIKSEDTYNLHKPLRKNFNRSKVIVSGINDTWQVDLVDVTKIAKENRGMKFLLTVIDVFSKFAYIEPIKNKTSESILYAFKKLFKIKKPKKI